MTDRELLEMAAKAAGFKDATWAAEQACIATLEQKRGFKLFWSPIEDDGDALRLAVKLQMDVCFGANYVTVRGSVQSPVVNNADDPYAATRRAIVRAAAEIGKGMP